MWEKNMTLLWVQSLDMFFGWNKFELINMNCRQWLTLSEARVGFKDFWSEFIIATMRTMNLDGVIPGTLDIILLKTLYIY